MAYSGNEETETYTGKLVKETDMAKLINFDGESDQPIWVPKSQIKSEEPTKGEAARKEGLVDYELPVWLAIEKGLE